MKSIFRYDYFSKKPASSKQEQLHNRPVSPLSAVPYTKPSPIVADLRISEEIDERLRQDLAQCLTVGHQDTPDLSGTRTASRESSIFAYPQHPARNANGHANLPVRLLDTADMVKYLAEQRAKSKAFGSVTQGQTADLSKRSSLAFDSSRRSIVSRPRGLSLAMIKTHRRSISFIALAIVVVVSAIAITLILSVRQLLVSAITQSYIEWTTIRFDEYTPNTLHMAATGRLANMNINGVLEAAEYDMFAPGESSLLLGKLQLPNIDLRRPQDISASVDQSIVLYNKRAASYFFSNLGSTSAKLELRGTAQLKWNGFRTSINMNTLVSKFPGFGGKVDFRSNSTFSVTPSPTPGDGSFLLHTNITVENRSPISTNLGKLDLMLHLANNKSLGFRTSNATFEAKSNLWQLQTKLSRHDSAATTAESQLISALLSRRQTSLRLEVVESIIETYHLNYTTALAKGLSNNITFGMGGESSPASSGSIHDLTVESHNATSLSMSFGLQHQLSLPYELESKERSAFIDRLDVRTIRGDLIAFCHATQSQLEAKLSDPKMSGEAGTTDHFRGVHFEITNGPALKAALSAREVMRLNGTFDVYLGTAVGRVNISGFSIESSVPIAWTD